MLMVFLTCLLFCGCFLVLLNGIIKSQGKQIEYRYLPQDMDTWLRSQPHASATFANMFGDNVQQAGTGTGVRTS